MFDNVHFDPKFGVFGMGIGPVFVDSAMQTCVGQYEIMFFSEAPQYSECRYRCSHFKYWDSLPVLVL